MIEFLVRNVAVGLIGLLAVFLASRQSASVRHAIAAVALLGTIFVPLAGLLLPKQELRVLPPVAVASRSIEPLTAPVDAVSPSIQVAATLATVNEERHVPWVAIIWSLGSLILFGRILLGFVAVHRWRKKGRAIPDKDTFVVPGIQIPMTAWMGRHYIYLPESYRTWSADRQESVLQHERAHIQRGDWFYQVAGQLLCAAFWMNPVQWLLNRVLRQLSEVAADDLALASGVTPSRYADDLLAIAREANRGMPSIALAMAANGHVTRRIRMILDPHAPRRPIGRAGLAGLFGTLFLVSVPLCAFALSPSDASKSSESLMQSKPQKPKGMPQSPNDQTPYVEVETAVVKPDAKIGLPGMPRLWIPDKQGASVINVDNYIAHLRTLGEQNLVAEVIVFKPPQENVTRGAYVWLGKSYRFEVETKVNADNSITMHVTLGDGELKYDRSATFRTKNDQGVLLAMRSKSDPSSTMGLLLRPRFLPLTDGAKGQKMREKLARTEEQREVLLKVAVLDRYAPESQHFKSRALAAGNFGSEFVAPGTIERLMKGNGREGHIVTAPILRTLTGEEASLSLSVGNEQFKLRFLPVLDSYGQFTLSGWQIVGDRTKSLGSWSAQSHSFASCIQFPDPQTPGGVKAIVIEASIQDASTQQQAP